MIGERVQTTRRFEIGATSDMYEKFISIIGSVITRAQKVITILSLSARLFGRKKNTFSKKGLKTMIPRTAAKLSWKDMS
jgi:hypothetical protein